MRTKNLIISISILILGLLIGGMFVKYTAPVCNNFPDNNSEEKSDIAYTTFSSSNADFTFEYPDTWTYEEIENNGTMNWMFYSKSAGNHNDMPYLGIQSPIEDPGAIDYYSRGPKFAKGDSYSYTLSIFPTNDIETFVTYERYETGDNGSGFIYWQKEKYFANSSELEDNYNIMSFYGVPEDGQEIGLHIAQSIELK